MTLVKWMAAALLAFAGGAAAQVLPFPPAAQVKLAVDALSGKAYALDEANDRVQVYDRTGSLVKSIGVGPRPQYIAVDAATRRLQSRKRRGQSFRSCIHQLPSG